MCRGESWLRFFHALMDNHDQISQLPGCIYYDEFYKKIKNEFDAVHFKNFLKGL